MGAEQSQGRVISKQGAPPQKTHNEPPYPGPRAEYCFVNTEVTMSYHMTLGCSNMVTSNIDAYYPALAQTMDKGFRFLSFYHIPGQVSQFL